MSTSRIVRIVIGLALIAYGVFSKNSWFYLGAIPLIMGILDICPRKMLSKYFAKEECYEGDSCCSTNIDNSSYCTPKNSSEESSCCSVSTSDSQVKWSTNKENSCCSSNSQDGEMLIEILGTGCAKC
ncbi:MAG: DUF2892 domain-containing protein, partial [Sulfurovaceae bacterium]|nr:DUF2892 domain-containing protein [Sulfurovaceae bacterium]